MFKVTYTKSFLGHFKKLSHTNQVKTDTLVGLLTVDFRDSRLHTKKLHGIDDIYSFRIGRDYRCLFLFENGNTIKLVDIRHRKDIYKQVR